MELFWLQVAYQLLAIGALFMAIAVVVRLFTKTIVVVPVGGKKRTRKIRAQTASRLAGIASLLLVGGAVLYIVFGDPILRADWLHQSTK